MSIRHRRITPLKIKKPCSAKTQSRKTKLSNDRHRSSEETDQSQVCILILESWPVWTMPRCKNQNQPSAIVVGIWTQNKNCSNKTLICIFLLYCMNLPLRFCAKRFLATWDTKRRLILDSGWKCCCYQFGCLVTRLFAITLRRNRA